MSVGVGLSLLMSMPRSICVVLFHGVRGCLLGFIASWERNFAARKRDHGQVPLNDDVVCRQIFTFLEVSDAL